LIQSAIVTIANNYIAAEDTLLFTNQSGITGSFLNGTLTLSGAATVAEYEAAIHSVTYVNSSDNPSALIKTIEITVNDGDTDSNPVSRDISVTPVNDAPVESGIEPVALSYTENAGPLVISNALTLFDIDDIH